MYDYTKIFFCFCAIVYFKRKFIIFLLTGYICLLIYDVMNPEIGFIRGGLQALFNMIFATAILTLYKAL
mgnify:CR=1 FL=1